MTTETPNKSPLIHTVDMTLDHHSNTEFDIVISGGGLIGSLIALSLSALTIKGRALSIAVVENNAIHTDFSKSFDDRVLALSHGSAQYLKSLNLWPLITRFAEPIRTIHISDRGHYGKARLYADDYNVNALGYVIEMAALGQALLKALTEKSNVKWFSPDSIESINWQQSLVKLSLKSGSQLSCSLLLGADGANSICRAAANINVTEVDYQQSAIITNVSLSQAHNNVAFERFTEHGPIAMLPLSDLNGEHRCSLVWTVTPQQALELNQLDDDGFKQALQSAFGDWLGAVDIVGKRSVYPLKLMQAEQQIFHRMALVGNASHTIHPIAGQGFNLGLRDVKTLVQQIDDLLGSVEINSAKEKHAKYQDSNDNSADLGNFRLLTAYAAQRAKDHQDIINLTDSLVTLFSNHLPPLIAGRNISLKLLNYCQNFKSALAYKTMGY